MSTQYYSEFLGLKLSQNQVDLPQVSFLKLDNYWVNRKLMALVKRGGSTVWATTGSVLGIGAYSAMSSSYLVPNVEHIIRHRRNGATSYIEKLDWSAGTWSAITQGANTSFGAAGIMQFCQNNNLLVLCGGRPAKITDISSGNVNRLGGPAPTAAPTWGASGTGLTGRTSGFYTFYDSTSGWESSPSPLTALTTFTNQQIDWSALETTCAREGVDQKRLYRTQLGNEGASPYYRVATIALATTTYADTVADTSLTAQGPDIGDHNPPPSTSYICCQHEGVTWIANGNELAYSKPYDGTVVSQEYFSESRKFYLPARITGLASIPDFGKLLVFLPGGLGIFQITGRSHGTFELSMLHSGEGTNFPMSISWQENQCTYWGRSGPRLLTPSGLDESYDESLREVMREISTIDYASEVYISSAWHPILRQFVWFVAATDTNVSQWRDAITYQTVQWQDAITGATVEWQ